MSGHVFVAGPVSWNRIVVLDRLPEPVPHLQVAEEEYETVGATSAGKALGLAGLGREVLLHALFGADDDGARVRRLLAASGVTLLPGDGGVTERHLNLMTRAGERVSLYLSVPRDPDEGTDAVAPGVRAAMADAEALVLDLAPVSRRLLPAAVATGRPVWVDLHDYDGVEEFHRPFLAAADAVFCSVERIGNPVPFLRRCIADGATLAVCTLGADGAVALDEHQERHDVAAVPVDVRDTNGAGDAFLVGVLDATLAGAPLADALRAGAEHAASVLLTRHLHPSLDALLGP